MHLNKSQHSIITGHLRDLYDHFVTHMSHNRSKRRRVEKKKKTDSLPDLYLPMPCLPAPFSLCKENKGLKHLKECWCHLSSTMQRKGMMFLALAFCHTERTQRFHASFLSIITANFSVNKNGRCGATRVEVVFDTCFCGGGVQHSNLNRAG